MGRARSFLFVIVAGLAFGLVARALWAPMADGVGSLIASIPDLASGVPAWVWWTLFGISMSLICPLKQMVRKGSCGAGCR